MWFVADESIYCGSNEAGYTVQYIVSHNKLGIQYYIVAHNKLDRYIQYCDNMLGI